MAGKKLLVADDSLTIQKVIRLALSNEGYEIQAVSDGNDAIQQISLFRPDAVLIDVSLPGKNAFEVKRAINEHADLDEVRFILMSSAFEKVDEPQAAEVRFHGRLTKPFDPAHLRQVLTETLAQVVAKRLEPTSLLQRPAATPAAALPQAPAPAQTPAPAHFAPPGAAAPSQPPAPTIAPSAAQVATLAPPPPQASHQDDSGDILLDFSVSPPAPHGEPAIGDDWLEPVHSNEPIVSPPPAAETISQLWDQEPTLSTDLAAHLQPPPPKQSESPAASRTPPPPTASVSLDSQDTAPHGSDPDADIRHLTESTIRMSGLDDFEWSVNEPSLKPPAHLLDAGDSSFQIELSTDPASPIPPFKPEFVPEISNVAVASNTIEVESPSLAGIPAPSAQVQNAASPSDFYRDPADVTKKLTRPTPFTPPPSAPMSAVSHELDLPDPFPAPSSTPTPPAPPKRPQNQGQSQPPASAPPRTAPPGTVMAEAVGISSDQIEELLRKELQKVLPDLAERIIKQEIHRMLSSHDGA